MPTKSQYSKTDTPYRTIKHAGIYKVPAKLSTLNIIHVTRRGYNKKKSSSDRNISDITSCPIMHL
jgi:hypothetical protein